MKSNQQLFMQILHFIVKTHYGLIVGGVIILVSCNTTSPEQYWTKQYQQCTTQQKRLQKPPKVVEEYCQQWESPLKRAQWLEKKQGDPILIVENYLKHLKRFPNSQKARALLVQARINYIDNWVREMDSAIEQRNSVLIWKLAKAFTHIENLLKDYSPIPEMLSHYIRDTPEIRHALQIIEAEIDQASQPHEPIEAMEPTQKKGRFYQGFTAVLVVFCQNEMGVCQERYRTHSNQEE